MSHAYPQGCDLAASVAADTKQHNKIDVMLLYHMCKFIGSYDHDVIDKILSLSY